MPIGNGHLATAEQERGEDLLLYPIPGGDAGLLNIPIFGRRPGAATRRQRLSPKALPALITSLQAAMAAMPR